MLQRDFIGFRLRDIGSDWLDKISSLVLSQDPRIPIHISVFSVNVNIMTRVRLPYNLSCKNKGIFTLLDIQLVRLIAYN